MKKAIKATLLEIIVISVVVSFLSWFYISSYKEDYEKRFIREMSIDVREKSCDEVLSDYVWRINVFTDHLHFALNNDLLTEQQKEDALFDLRKIDYAFNNRGILNKSLTDHLYLRWKMDDDLEAFRSITVSCYDYTNESRQRSD